MAIQGTTPIETFDVAQEFDYSNVYVTIDQDGLQITKQSRDEDSGIEITKNYDESGQFVSSTVAVYLTQEDTLKFEVGKARVQIKWIDFLGNARATDIGTITIEEALLREEIRYGN